jgi:CubicO group peptidase (beta-lactamase class C family)
MNRLALWKTTLAPCLSILVLVSACDGPDVDEGARRSSDDPTFIEQVESGLLPAVVLEGEELPTWTLQERLEHYEVPGVSVAVIEGGAVAWAKGYGVADLETGATVTTETLFQAASISKPVAALAALSLVEEGLIRLDAPVNDYLTSWRLPDNEFTADSVVTLRHLLTHSAGLTVWGFPGYRKDEPFAGGQEVATNPQVLDGDGNTDPVRVYKEPGTSWQYSGGGYTVMEQMVEDVTGLPFHEVLQERVLGPAGMTRSTYAQPLPRDRWSEAARGHRSDGSEVEGEWHTYPEQAAAGLWTTPTDLAALSTHLLRILDGSIAEGVLSSAMLDQMLTPNHDGQEGFSNWGLGFGLSEPGAERTFGHGGSNEGFKANWVVYRDAARGYVVMTNGDRGSPLAGEIARAIAVAYDWPEGKPEARARVHLDSAVVAALAGEYEIEGLADFIITAQPGPDGTLEIDVPGQGTMTFHPASADEWFELADGDVMVIERDDQGNVRRAVVGGQTVLIRR